MDTFSSCPTSVYVWNNKLYIAQNQRKQGTEIKHPFNNNGSTMVVRWEFLNMTLVTKAVIDIYKENCEHNQRNRLEIPNWCIDDKSDQFCKRSTWIHGQKDLRSPHSTLPCVTKFALFQLKLWLRIFCKWIKSRPLDMLTMGGEFSICARCDPWGIKLKKSRQNGHDMVFRKVQTFWQNVME